MLRAAGAQEKAIPYCVGWVQRFFASHPGRRRRDLGRGEIEASLAEMARHPGVSNWQVQQARDALELYYEQFRGIALEPRPETPTSHGIPPAGTEAASPDAKPHASVFREPPFRSDVAQAQMIMTRTWRISRAGRRRRQCPRWIRRYVAFHGWRKPSTLKAAEVRDFLRHLAVEAQVASYPTGGSRRRAAGRTDDPVHAASTPSGGEG